MVTIEGIENEVIVSEYAIRAGHYGPMGTLYHGDAERISDFLADPAEDLDIYGCIHHIHLTFADDVFTMRIQFMDEVGAVKFSHEQAREIIFALLGVKPYADAPANRR